MESDWGIFKQWVENNSNFFNGIVAIFALVATGWTFFLLGGKAARPVFTWAANMLKGDRERRSNQTHAIAVTASQAIPTDKPLVPTVRPHAILDTSELEWLQFASEVNARFFGEAEVIARLRHEPRVIHKGDYSPDIEILKASARNPRQKRASREERQAILVRDPTWNADPITFECEAAIYPIARALRLAGRHPPIITGNGVLCCAEEKALLVHHRSKEIEPFPGRRHFYGGALVLWGFNDDDNLQISNAAWRELKQETGLDPDDIPRLAQCAAVLSREIQSGYIQVNYLGVNFTLQQAKATRASGEGTSEIVSLSKLETLLLNPDYWVPSGQMNILLWLAMGAPIIAGAPGCFDPEEAKAIYRSWVEKTPSKKQGIR